MSWAVDEPSGEVALSSFALSFHLFPARKLHSTCSRMEEDTCLHLGSRKCGAVDLNSFVIMMCEVDKAE